jgi:signal transduction histidine kinase
MLRDKLLINNILQMAHDIRSPLFALQVILQTPGEFSDTKRNLLIKAVQRLQDIADGILVENKIIKETDLTLLINDIVNEKQISFPNYKIEFHSPQSLFIECDSTEIKRIISNLINNSIEAYDANFGKITVSLIQVDGTIQILIKDNGKGIPLSLIPHIFGASHGKKTGYGLGLSHAKSYIESIGGSIDITSGNAGTEVCLKL